MPILSSSRSVGSQCLRLPRLAPLVLSIAIVGFAAAAAATPIIDPATMPFTHKKGTGTIEFLGSSVGLPAGGIQLGGSTDAQDVLLSFQVSDLIGGNELKKLTVAVDTQASTGVGFVNGSGKDFKAATASGGGWTLSPNRFKEGTSDIFFLSFASSLNGADLSFDMEFKEGTANVSAMILSPEPSTALLLLLGLVGLTAARRRSPR